MEDSFSHGACFRQTSGLNPCFGACPSTADHRLDTGDSTSRSVIHIEDASIGQGPKMRAFIHYSSHLSSFEQWHGWRPTPEPKKSTKILPSKVHALEGAQVPPLCVVSNQDINETLYHPLYPGRFEKRFWSATQIPLHLSLSPTRLRHTRYDTWVHHSHSRQTSMEQILRTGTWFCHNTFTDFYLKELFLYYSADLIQLGPVVAAEPILHPTGDH